MKIDVKHVAKLANLPLTASEEQKFEKQLSEVLDYVEKLKEIDTKDTETTSQVTGLENVVREDKEKQCLSQEDAVSGTEAKKNGLFEVSAILD